MLSILRLLIAAISLCACAATYARQDPSQVRRAVEEFLAIQTKGLPGTVSFTIGAIDPNNNLAPCPALEAFIAPGARLWGKTSVAVRCRAEGGWSLYVPVHIKLLGEYLVIARPLTQGQIVAREDLATQTGDLAELPSGVLTDPSQAIGRSLTMSVVSGRPLRADMLRQTPALQQGQSVKVVSYGPGFQVATEGKALTNAIDGQVVQVRTASGQTVTGIARHGGSVEIKY